MKKNVAPYLYLGMLISIGLVYSHLVKYMGLFEGILAATLLITLSGFWAYLGYAAYEKKKIAYLIISAVGYIIVNSIIFGFDIKNYTELLNWLTVAFLNGFCISFIAIEIQDEKKNKFKEIITSLIVSPAIYLVNFHLAWYWVVVAAVFSFTFVWLLEYFFENHTKKQPA